MSTMRAIIVKGGKGPIENLYLGEIEKPIPKDDEVLVQIIAFGLNRMDIIQRNGNYPLPPHAPSTLGVEFSGHITEVGNNASKWKVGDEVLGLAAGGAYAEYIVLPASHVMRKPSHLSWIEAASIPEVYITAYLALIRLGRLKKGEDVMVHAAASGVGIAAIELAKYYGARHIIGTTSSRDKIDFLLSNSATHGVNYKSEDFAIESDKITEGKGVDVIIDFVGASYWEKNIASLARDGRMTMLGLLGGAIAPSVNLGQLLYKRLTVQGSALRNRPIAQQSDLIAEFERDILPHITGSQGQGPMKTHIHRVWPWTEIQNAHRCMEANQNIGKIIMEIA